MNSLVELHEKLAEADAEEMEKMAEEDAAGRIMARGFWDEFQKMAQGTVPPKSTVTLGTVRRVPKSTVTLGTVRRVPAAAPAVQKLPAEGPAGRKTMTPIARQSYAPPKPLGSR